MRCQCRAAKVRLLTTARSWLPYGKQQLAWGPTDTLCLSVLPGLLLQVEYFTGACCNSAGPSPFLLFFSVMLQSAFKAASLQNGFES
jgi:hypothetical protein